MSKRGGEARVPGPVRAPGLACPERPGDQHDQAEHGAHLGARHGDRLPGVAALGQVHAAADHAQARSRCTSRRRSARGSRRSSARCPSAARRARRRRWRTGSPPAAAAVAAASAKNPSGRLARQARAVRTLGIGHGSRFVNAQRSAKLSPGLTVAKTRRTTYETLPLSEGFYALLAEVSQRARPGPPRRGARSPTRWPS